MSWCRHKSAQRKFVPLSAHQFLFMKSWTSSLAQAAYTVQQSGVLVVPASSLTGITIRLAQTSLLSGQEPNKFNWLSSMTISEPSGVCKMIDSIDAFSNTVTENTCINV